MSLTLPSRVRRWGRFSTRVMLSSSSSNSRWRLFSLPGVCTRISTNRSPLPWPLSIGHTLAADAQRRAGLGAFGHFQNMLAFQRGNNDFRAQRSLRKRDRDNAVQIVSLPLEEGMLLHVQDHIQVAGRATVKAAFAVSREANAGSVFDSGGNFGVNRPLAQHPAFAFALRRRDR